MPTLPTLTPMTSISHLSLHQGQPARQCGLPVRPPACQRSHHEGALRAVDRWLRHHTGGGGPGVGPAGGGCAGQGQAARVGRRPARPAAGCGGGVIVL